MLLIINFIKKLCERLGGVIALRRNESNHQKANSNSRRARDPRRLCRGGLLSADRARVGVGFARHWTALGFAWLHGLSREKTSRTSARATIQLTRCSANLPGNPLG